MHRISGTMLVSISVGEINFQWPTCKRDGTSKHKSTMVGGCRGGFIDNDIMLFFML